MKLYESETDEFEETSTTDFVMQQISNSIRDSIRHDVSMFTNIELL